MNKLIRVLLGIVVFLCGIGILSFDGYIITQERSLATLLLFIFLFGIGFAVAKVGYAIAKGKKIKEALTFFFFLGNSIR